ncbi:MAG: GreA/GreB family elongation factor [Flavobacteriaceae bacterium]|nr:GreA/GreB family elongation factor [Flavobacteriaceae bacterium]
MNTIKHQLHQFCKQYIQERAATIAQTIRSCKNDLNSETKSSAGDKHETGRAMIQLEMEKAGQQLASVQQMNTVLAKINPENSSSLVCLGSLVRLEMGTYYIGIAVGIISIEGSNYFGISTHSPIGKLLLGKKLGDTIQFQGKQIAIKELF